MRKPSFARTFGAVALTAWLLLTRYEIVRGDEPGPDGPLARRLPPACRAGIRRWRQDPDRRQPAEREYLRHRHRIRGAWWPSQTSAAGWPASPSCPTAILCLPSIKQRTIFYYWPIRIDRYALSIGVHQPRPHRPRRLGRRLVVRGGLAVVAPADVRRSGVSRRTTRTPALSIAGTLDLPFCPRELAAFPDDRSWSSPTRSAVGWPWSTRSGGRWSRSDHCRRTTSAAWPSLPTVAPPDRSPGAQPTGTDQLRRRPLGPVDSQSPAGLADGSLLEGRPGLRAPRRQPAVRPGRCRLCGGRPGAIAFDRRGHVIVALAGMDEVAIAAGVGQGPHRIVVGRRPAALAVSPDGESALRRR